MKKVLALILTVTMLLTFMGCNRTQDAAASSGDSTNGTGANTATGGTQEKHYKIGFSPMSLTDTFQNAVLDKCRELIEARGDTFVYADPNQDGALQINQIEDMIAQEIDALITTPVAADGILPALEQCEKAGVPVFNYDGAATDQQLVKTLVATDNYSCGYVMGKYLLENIGTSGTVIGLTVLSIESMNKRYQGFMDAIEGSDIEFVSLDYSGDLNGPIEDLIVANPDAIAYMGFNGPIAQVAYAMSNQYQRNLPVLSIDGSPEDKQAIRDGDFMACAAQSPETIAETIVDAMYKYLAGEEIESEYILDAFVIDKNNVEEYGFDGWQ